MYKSEELIVEMEKFRAGKTARIKYGQLKKKDMIKIREPSGASSLRISKFWHPSKIAVASTINSVRYRNY